MTQQQPPPDQFGHSSQAPQGSPGSPQDGGGQAPASQGGYVPPAPHDATQQMPPPGQPAQGGYYDQPPTGQPQSGGERQPGGQPQPGGPPQPGYAPQAGYQGPPQPNYGGPAGGPGFPPSGGPGGPGAPSEPGLFDLTLATPVAPRIAKLGLIALWALGGLTALSGLVGFITTVVVGVGPWGGGGAMVFGALVEMILAFALAAVIVVMCRLLGGLGLAVIARRADANQGSSSGAAEEPRRAPRVLSPASVSPQPWAVAGGSPRPRSGRGPTPATVSMAG